MIMPLLLPITLPPSHMGGADPDGWLWSDWSLEPTVVLGVLALAAGYLYLTGPRNRRSSGLAERPVTTAQRTAFLGGLLTLFAVLAPPLDDWSDHYLLSAHMVQHLLLTLAVPPLLLLGTPAWLLAPLHRRAIVDRVGRFLTRPVVAFVLFNAVFILWHMPVLYDAALRNEGIHVAEHLLFLVTGVLAWWPVVGPQPGWPRLSAPLQCLYYAAQTIPGGIVGAFITLAEPGLYRPYAVARRIFGLDLATDQEIAGLLMWVATSTIYLVLLTIIFFRWAGREDAAERSAIAPRRQTAPRG